MKKMLLFAVLSIVLFSTPAFAAEEVKVGAYVVNVGEYNIHTGAYKIDFYFWLKYDSSSDIVPDTFEFMNGRIDTKDIIIDKPGYKFYRIQADLYNSPSLKDYPLDKQNITIEVEDKILTKNKIFYAKDNNETGISDEIDIKGWTITKYGEEITDHNYSNWNESYSKYKFYITMERPSSSIYKTLIPLLLITISVWVIFFIPLREIGDRLFIGGSGLLAAIAFHIYLTGSLPSVGYLTLADKIMISSYATIVFSLVSSIYVDRQAVISKERAQAINRILSMADIIVPFLTFGIVSLI